MTSIDLWEVITEGPATGTAYGQTFHDEGDADAYAAAMRRAGYTADVSPCFGTQESAAAALAAAADFYSDPAITKAGEAIQ